MHADSQRLKQYLLGQLPEEETHALSNRVFDEAEFAELVEEAERDVLDAYVRGELEIADRLAVEERLLTSPAQLDKLRVARAIVERAHPLPAAAIPMDASARYKAHTRWPLAFGAVAATAVIALLAALLLYQKNRGLNAEVAQLRALDAAVRGDAHLSSFLILPNRRSESSGSVKVPAQTDLVRLDFELPGRAQRSRVTLANAGGEVISDAMNLPSQPIGESNYVSIWLRSASLAPGRFDAAITAENSKDAIHYSFAVERSQ